ncbi:MULTISPECIES: hypothetical protein [unclassified Nocardioides]|uniref:hypothetical protein n=1 Tax=unclassified Nocardioides TaxID=2615069 RepID=UPI0006FC01E0|nr:MULTISPECIES: hypothetical protein [unclassified Nocardioides]KRA32653.1 hypothetical protein ASD81_14095 [Nocardioides sp. Root614]KRA89306.1 hypothetical protein ASD84_14360 [Nocardioides sp. Root682]
MPTDHRAPRRRRRAGRPRNVVIWLAGGASAAVLVLGTSGALASWTSAVVGNDTNTVATAKAVILSETDGSTTCRSSDQTTNVSTCSGINKYGGTVSPLMPGGSRTLDVTFSNIGAANAVTFSLAPGACSQTPTAGSGTPAATNLCTATSELTVGVSCSPGATYVGGSAWVDLVHAAGVPPTATKTHTATGAELNAGAQWTCRFTIALNAAASIASQNVIVSQPLTWTLAS